MRGREFLPHVSAAVPTAAFVAWPRRLRAAEPPLSPGWRNFEIVTSVEVAAPARGERINSLDPATFRYEIHSRELESRGGGRQQESNLPGSV